MIRTAILLLALAAPALAQDAFTLSWEPVNGARMQYFTATHVASGRVLNRLKLAWCVSLPWYRTAGVELMTAKPEQIAEAQKNSEFARSRNTWAQAVALETYNRLVLAESPDGIKAAKLAEANAAADVARQAAARIAEVQAAYPLEKLPTVSVTAATAEIVK